MLLFRTSKPAELPAAPPAVRATTAIPAPGVPTVAAPTPAAATVAPPRTLLDMLMPKREAPPEADDHTPGKGDLDRVLALPVVDVMTCEDLTDELLLPGAVAWPGRLKPAQSAALHQARAAGGLLAPIGVGHGKTLISALLPTVLKAKLAVLLVPAALVGKTERDLAKLRQHWRILPPSQLRVVSYNKLSSPGSTSLFEDLGPDLVVADEAHNLKNAKSARGARFLRYFKLWPATRFCALSGTMTSKSLYDYWHLAKLALKDGSPLPVKWPEVGVWDCVFGSIPDEQRFAAAASGARVATPGPDSEKVSKRMVRWAMRNGQGGDINKVPVPEPREAFSRRLTTAPGVVATTSGECDASLEIELLDRLPIPGIVAETLQTLEDTWEIGGNEIADAMTLARVRRQVASGFWYRWVWPGGVVDKEWLEARSEWQRAVRRLLGSAKATTGLDSPALVAAAAERKDTKVSDLWERWEEWKAVKHRPEPPVEAVWLSEYLVDAAIERAEHRSRSGPVIIWYESRALEAVFRARGLPVFGAGGDSDKLVELASKFDAGKKPPPIICCSIAAQGTGKNLQAWYQSVVSQPSSSGVTWEQLLGRLHRQGQQADSVQWDVFAHVPAFMDAFESAKVSAMYQQSTMRQPQRLLFADVVCASDHVRQR